jgi:hypothetical protein
MERRQGEVSENGESRTTTRTRTIGKVISSIVLVIVLVPRPLAVTGENRWRNEYEHENDGERDASSSCSWPSSSSILGGGW